MNYKKNIKILSLLLCTYMLCVCTLCSCMWEYEYSTPPSYDTTDYTRESAKIRLEDDFYGYVNFDFLWNNNIPSNMSEYSMGTIVDQNNDNLLTDEIIKIAESSESFPFGSDNQKIQDFYLQYLDIDAREKIGISPLMEGINAIEEAENINDFVSACGLLYRNYGCSILCSPYVSADFYNSSQYIIYLSQTDLIYSAEELLNTADCAENLQKLIASVLQVYGSENYNENAYKIVSMLLDIAESTSDMQKINISEAYNEYTSEKLQQLFKNIDVPSMLTEFGVGNAEKLIVYDVEQANKLNTYLTDEYLPIWKDYAVCRLLYTYSAYLPEKYNVVFNVQNNTKYKNLQEQAVLAVKKELAGELGNIYAEKYCDEETLKAVTELTESIKSAYYNVIINTEKLNDETRKNLLLKLEKMTFNIGYPLENYLSSSVISGGLLESCISIKSSEISENLSLYKTEVNKDIWQMTPQTFNAVYEITKNSITIPMALFNKPYFDKDADFYTNLGGLGTVIAHEMTHAFDETGIQFDENGCYNPQWTGVADKERIEKLKSDAENYFGNFKLMNTYKIDGSLTIDENIADAGALSVIVSMTDNKEELRKIFNNYAVTWATLSYNTTAVESLFEDVHSPAEIRVNAVLSTTDKFYFAYDITENDKMYIAPNKRIRIW